MYKVLLRGLIVLIAFGLLTTAVSAAEDWKVWGDVSDKWENGALNDEKSDYFEGEVVPYYLTASVQFTDTSTGPEAVQWIWLFGDETMSIEQNPEHYFSKPGTYTVELYITWADCHGITYDWESSSRTIKVS